MKRLLAVILLLHSITYTFSLHADSTGVPFELDLKTMNCEKISEINRDEIYFSLLVNKNGKVTQHRVPKNFPLFFPNYKNKPYNDIALYKGKLQSGEKITLIIELIESDLSNFNPDDLLGMAKLTLENKDNTLTPTWDLPTLKGHHETKMITKGKQYQYIMSGDDALCKVSFNLKIK